MIPDEVPLLADVGTAGATAWRLSQSWLRRLERRGSPATVPRRLGVAKGIVTRQGGDAGGGSGSGARRARSGACAGVRPKSWLPRIGSFSAFVALLDRSALLVVEIGAMNGERVGIGVEHRDEVVEFLSAAR